MAKSILDVDVQDEKFLKFKALFDQYQTALKKMPGAWGNVGDATEKAAESTEVLNERMGRMEDHLTDLAHGQRQWLHTVRDTDRAFAGVDTRLRNIGATLRSLWGSTAAFARATGRTALGSGLLGAGALWGLTNLAHSAGDTRRTSQGLGLAPGELGAYRTNFSRFADPGSVLGNIANARNDPSAWWAFTSMGMSDFQSRSNADLATAMPLRAKQIFNEGGGNAQYAQARGLTTFFSMEDLRRLQSMTDQEIEAAGKRYQADVRQMAVSDALAKRWQDLSVQLNRASTAVETSFLRALGPLAPELEKLSDAFTQAVTNVLTTDKLREIITATGRGIEQAARYLASPEFMQDMRRLGQTIEDIWQAIQRVARWINGLTLSGPPGPDTRDPANPRYQVEDYDNPEEVSRRRREWGLFPYRLPADSRGRQQGGAGFDPISAAERKFELPEYLLDKMWMVESARGTQMLGPVTASGERARGHFQFMPRTGAEYGLTRDQDFDDLEMSSQAAGRYIFNLRRQFRGDLRAAVAAYNYGQGNVQRLMRERGERWEEGLPRETAQYLARVLGASYAGPRIVIENNTGGSATVTQNVIPYQ